MIKKNQAQGKGAIRYRLDSNNDFNENINSCSKTNVTLLMLLIDLYFIDQESLMAMERRTRHVEKRYVGIVLMIGSIFYIFMGNSPK